MLRLLIVLLIPLLTLATDLNNQMIAVAGGKYKPILAKGRTVKIKSFLVDETPVTNHQFSDFVLKNSNWSKGKVKVLFADSNYLKHWHSPTEVGDPTLDNSPVVNVSWFAAIAYCEARGARLPTVDEWEYMAGFGPVGTGKDVKTIILDWYSRSTPEKMPNVKSTFKNKFGVWDVHGLIWEWNYDFNTTFVTGESRGDSALEKSMFCGSGSVGAANPADYAAFMRFGFRSSLKGNYTVANLGFRCARDLAQEAKK